MVLPILCWKRNLFYRHVLQLVLIIELADFSQITVEVEFPLFLALLNAFELQHGAYLLPIILEFHQELLALVGHVHHQQHRCLLD